MRADGGLGGGPWAWCLTVWGSGVPHEETAPALGQGGPGCNEAARLPQAQPERRDSPSDHQLQA